MSTTERARAELPHIAAGRRRLEDLWPAAVDYCEERVAAAMARDEMLHLDMDFTAECMLKCFYCDRTPDRFADVPNRIELTTERRKEIILQAAALGARAVEFPGAGEPMIDPGFWEVMEHIHRHRMTPVVFASGYHLDRAAADRLYDLGATIVLKYNSTSRAVQDRMVGVKGYGEKANAALHLLVERGFNRSIPTRMAIDMVVTPKHHELSEIESVFRWCRDNNVASYIMTLIPEGMADHKKLILERERSNELLARIQRIDEQEYGLHYKSMRPMAGGYRCRQINVGLFVNLFGEVYDCNGLGHLVGHLGRDSLADIWRSRWARSLRARPQDGFCPPRERVWEGVDASGMERKLESYWSWAEAHGQDPVAERAIEVVCPAGKRP